MRLFPVAKSLRVRRLCLYAAAAAVIGLSSGAQAQTVGTTTYTAPYKSSSQQQALNDASSAAYNNAQQKVMSDLMAQMQAQQFGPKTSAAAPVKQSLFGTGQPSTEDYTEEELKLKLQDPDSPQYKAYVLAKQAKKDRDLFFAPVKEDDKQEMQLLDGTATPPEMDELQNVKESHANETISDDAVSKEMSIDIRRDAQREAALSYGARGGLSKRSYQIMERLNDYQTSLDQVFNFRQLLVKAPSGLLIEPPIVREALDATTITDEGAEAAVADQVLKINKQAKIVTAPRDWRQYLVMPYDTVIPPPPRVLWPKDDKEQAEWDGWVKQGWDAGYSQGEDSFETSLNQLVADYAGMVRYRTLLAEGKISQPFALQEDRGVTGGKNEMRVGDRALRLTGPSEFLTGANLWKPADR